MLQIQIRKVEDTKMHNEKTIDIDTKKAVYEDNAGNVVHHEQRSVTRDESVSARNVIQQIMYVLLTIINGIIAIRFILSLFGANRSNAFADLIYTFSSPLVAPFRSLFSVDTRVGETSGRFEVESVVAIIVYSLIVWMLIRIFAVGTKDGNDA